MGEIVEGMILDGLLDWYGKGDERPAPTCNRCGMTPLEWVDIGLGRWRLYDPDRFDTAARKLVKSKPHKCPRPSAADDFKDVKL